MPFMRPGFCPTTGYHSLHVQILVPKLLVRKIYSSFIHFGVIWGTLGYFGEHWGTSRNLEQLGTLGYFGDTLDHFVVLGDI